MKVVQINVTYSSGSTGQIVQKIHKFLNDREIENYIIYGYGPKSQSGHLSIYNYWTTHLHSFLSRYFCMQGLGSLLPTYKAIRFLKRINPDIVHLHNIHGHYLNYPLLFYYLKKRNIQVIWTFHDCWPYTGKCAHYSEKHCMKWKTGCFDCPNLSTYPDSKYDGTRRNYNLKKRIFFKMPNLHIVANSNWLFDEIKSSFLKNKDIYKIYNGIDTSVFYPRNREAWRKENKYNQTDIIVLGVSSVWKKEKGFDVFLKISKVLPDNYKFVMVGVNEKQLRELPNNIYGILRTENINKLAEIYSSCDVLLNPSKEETFGMVTAEAIACGIPAIVSNCTACPEVVSCCNAGMIVDMDNLKEIVDALLKLGHTNIELKQEISENARKKFSSTVMCENYFKLYQSISIEKSN